MKKLLYALIIWVLAELQVLAASLLLPGYGGNDQSFEFSGTNSSFSVAGEIGVGAGGERNTLFILNDADINATSYTIIGEGGNYNKVIVSGSGSSLSGGMILGIEGVGNSLIITNGGSMYGWASIGFYDGYANEILVTGTGSRMLTSGGITVGYRAGGNRLTIEDGGSGTVGNIQVGYSDGVRYDGDGNTVSITGAGSQLNCTALILGGERAEGNRVVVSNGAVLTSSSTSIKGGFRTLGAPFEYNGPNNAVLVTGVGSKWENSGVISLGGYDIRNNSLEISSGGEVIAHGGIEIDSFDPSLEEEVELNPDDGVFLSDGGRLTVGTNFNASMNGFHFGDGGTLSVKGQLSGLSTLEEGRRLEAIDILGDLTVIGILAPGNSPADSILQGALTLDTNGRLEMEIGGLGLGTEYDRLTVTGNAELDGMLELVLLDGFNAEYGDVFDLFNWDGGVSGEFATISSSNLPGGLYWDTSELYTTGQISVIPEPGVVSLMVIFGGAMWFVRRYFPCV